VACSTPVLTMTVQNAECYLLLQRLCNSQIMNAGYLLLQRLRNSQIMRGIIQTYGIILCLDMDYLIKINLMSGLSRLMWYKADLSLMQLACMQVQRKGYWRRCWSNKGIKSMHPPQNLLIY
jgi:hypothetical protein